jgi:hypothetical protein
MRLISNAMCGAFVIMPSSQGIGGSYMSMMRSNKRPILIISSVTIFIPTNRSIPIGLYRKGQRSRSSAFRLLLSLIVFLTFKIKRLGKNTKELPE